MQCVYIYINITLESVFISMVAAVQSDFAHRDQKCETLCKMHTHVQLLNAIYPFACGSVVKHLMLYRADHRIKDNNSSSLFICQMNFFFFFFNKNLIVYIIMRFDTVLKEVDEKNNFAFIGECINFHCVSQGRGALVACVEIPKLARAN